MISSQKKTLLFFSTPEAKARPNPLSFHCLFCFRCLWIIYTPSQIQSADPTYIFRLSPASWYSPYPQSDSFIQRHSHVSKSPTPTRFKASFDLTWVELNAMAPMLRGRPHSALPRQRLQLHGPVWRERRCKVCRTPWQWPASDCPYLLNCHSSRWTTSPNTHCTHARRPAQESLFARPSVMSQPFSPSIVGFLLL